MNIESEIKALLSKEFPNSKIKIIDDSSGHSRQKHLEDVTHLRVYVVSEVFAGLNRVKRNQAVFKALGDWATRLHSVTVFGMTAEEAAARADDKDLVSCLHGD